MLTNSGLYKGKERRRKHIYPYVMMGYNDLTSTTSLV
jgi:hypothetical protein